MYKSNKMEKLDKIRFNKKYITKFLDYKILDFHGPSLRMI